MGLFVVLAGFDLPDVLVGTGGALAGFGLPDVLVGTGGALVGFDLPTAVFFESDFTTGCTFVLFVVLDFLELII